MVDRTKGEVWVFAEQEEGKLAEIAREETSNRYLLAYTPKRFGLCLRLAGLRGGTQLYRKLWGEH